MRINFQKIFSGQEIPYNFNQILQSTIFDWCNCQGDDIGTL